MSDRSLSRILKDSLKKNTLTKGAVQSYLSWRTEKGNAKKRQAVQQFGLEYLSEITIQFRNNGLLGFADFGTLLGLIREGALLEHDMDVDVSVVLRSQSDIAVVERVMRDLGYSKSFDYLFEDRIQEQSYRKGWLKVDVCYYNPSEDKMFCYLFYWEEGKIYPRNQMDTVQKTSSRIDGVNTIVVRGNRVVVPDNAEQVLIEKYGDNWRQPDKGWVYWKGPNTTESLGLGTQIIY